MFEGQSSAIDFIKICADKADQEIDAGSVAMAMVCDDHQGLVRLSLERYIRHFQTIATDVKKRHQALLDAGSADDAPSRLAALKHIIVDEYDYRPDDDGHEILESADIIRSIDRRRGSSAVIGLLYLDAARKCGWNIEGLDVASNLLCRLEHGGERLIFDPAQSCKIMQAHNLRDLVKSTLGDDAELSSKYMDGLDIRQSIIHLCNFIKLRRIEMGEYDIALEMIERMRLLMPDEYRLLLDAGVLYARTHKVEEAKHCLGRYIDFAPNPYDRFEAKALLDDLD